MRIPLDASALPALQSTPGRGPGKISWLDRTVPWRDEVEVAVFNPSPRPRTDLVRFPLEGHPFTPFVDGSQSVHPFMFTSLLGGGITVDGLPARVLVDDSPHRIRVIPEQHLWTVEWVAEDLPAFGWRRYRLPKVRPYRTRRMRGREVSAGSLSVTPLGDALISVARAPMLPAGSSSDDPWSPAIRAHLWRFGGSTGRGQDIWYKAHLADR